MDGSARRLTARGLGLSSIGESILGQVLCVAVVVIGTVAATGHAHLRRHPPFVGTFTEAGRSLTHAVLVETTQRTTPVRHLTCACASRAAWWRRRWLRSVCVSAGATRCHRAAR